MIRALACAAAAAFVALPALAHSPDEAAVALALESLSQAIIAADKAKLESLTLPEITYGHSDGRVQDRATFIDALVAKKSIFRTLDSTKQTITVAGDTAIVRNHMSADVDPGGRHVELEMIYVWLKRGGEWKLVLRQASKI
jgi:ketosteroid isomerase-like protein